MVASRLVAGCAVPRGVWMWCKPYLDETDVGALLPEALTADVEAVLADETSRVGADTAVQSVH